MPFARRTCLNQLDLVTPCIKNGYARPLGQTRKRGRQPVIPNTLVLIVRTNKFADMLLRRLRSLLTGVAITLQSGGIR